MKNFSRKEFDLQDIEYTVEGDVFIRNDKKILVLPPILRNIERIISDMEINYIQETKKEFNIEHLNVADKFMYKYCSELLDLKVILKLFNYKFIGIAEGTMFKDGSFEFLSKTSTIKDKGFSFGDSNWEFSKRDKKRQSRLYLAELDRK